MKKIMMIVAASAIALTASACDNCDRTVVTTCASTNGVTYQIVQTEKSEKCQCKCHEQKACKCGCNCCVCHCNCQCECCKHECNCPQCKQIHYGNKWLGVTITMATDQTETMSPTGSQPMPNPSQLQSTAQPQPQPQLMNGQQPMPVIPTYRTWVEGRYVSGLLQDGRIINTWIPGHYEECILINR